jgi:phospholipid/cholesterol/gamma-HCH transport system permease protein
LSRSLQARAAPALRPVAAPISNFVTQVGGMTVLARATIAAALRPPYSYGPELSSQFLFALKVCWMPMALASVAFTYGPAGIQAAGFLAPFGALDRLGGLFAQVVLRELAPLVCAIVIAGVAGTAMCADLGARKIREELDALSVLGVDVVKSLVVPRFLSLMVLTGLFDIYALLLGTAGGLLVTISHHQPVAPFLAAYLDNATPLELGASLLKTTIFGGLIAIICCYKGLAASGGPEGVGRAVNQAVVLSFLAFGAVDYVFTQTLLATNPALNAVR